MNKEAFDNLIKLGQMELLERGEHKLPFSILKTSEIFKGHFPQQPVLPGVVMIEITKRAAELAIQTPIKLVSAGNFKFLMMVSPNEIGDADILFTVAEIENGWRVKAQIIYQGQIYFKADATYEQH